MGDAGSESEDDDEEEDEEDAGEGEASGPKRKTKTNRLQEMAEADDEEPRGVIYLGHIPKGFYEPQMRTFFGQFGTVTRLRLSRSKKNAASKGYAFIEFKEESVAQIVAQTMDKYLLFEKQLVCHLIPKAQQHPKLFKGWRGNMVNRSEKRRKQAAAIYNDRPSVATKNGDVPQVTLRQAARRNKQEKKLAEKLKSLGVDFDANEASDGKRPSARKEPAKPKADVAAAAVAAVAAAAKNQAKKASPAKVSSAAPPATKKRKEAPAPAATTKAKKRKASA